MKVDESWWNEFIDLAQQREDALGVPASDSPTAEQLRTLLDMSLQYHSQTDPEWWLMKGLPFGMAFVCSLWTEPEKDPIGVHMFPELQLYIAWHVVQMVGGDRAFLNDYSAGKVILDESIAGLSIGSIVENLRKKTMETQAQIESQSSPTTANLETLNALFKRWLLLYLAFSDARTGTTFQKALAKAKLPPKKKWFQRG
jgi:hypothetical protein